MALSSTPDKKVRDCCGVQAYHLITLKRALSCSSLLYVVRTGTNPAILGSSVAPGGQGLLPDHSPETTVNINELAPSCREATVVIFFLPCKPPPPHPDKPPSRPTRQSLISVHFRSVSGPFGSVWLRFGSVSGPFRVRFRVLGGVGVGSGRAEGLLQGKRISLSYSEYLFQKL